ncbi:DUF4249 family protein [Flavobacterium sp. NST-5]|uniref:DUF4249 family protein n=1 Tax=Flavobacterium ichthyis TaxID=2698827 RepID=A0ABW9Z6U3_9FLAO|nr:DUF4249 domain-containing protein [Flavobacterium ichthyis]NBL63941.1 DUF4249 family protein [Flavobacterium ichthyis]
MKKAIKFLILCFAILFISCEEVINVDLDTATAKLVIDASINWEIGTAGNEQIIKLSTTTGYYSDVFPTVSGASVTVENSSSEVFNFVEVPGTGEYLCNDFQPSIGEVYTLTILLNGEIYSATETLIASPEIDETIIQDNNGGFTGNEIEITSFFQDNPLEENYYLFGHKSNRVAFPEYRVIRDESVNGNQIPMIYFNEDLTQGDVLEIKLYGISRRYYEYFNKIISAAGSGGGPFPAIPSAVRGNIVNQTNFDNFAYGYFRLSQIDVKSYTIQ